MVISDALPVQFWPTALETFNEKVVPGIFRRCFCQPFNATDTIRIQVDFGVTDNLYLKIYDSDSVLLQTITFSNTIGTVYTASFSPSTYGITNEEIQLKIFRGANVLYRSDCLEIKSSHDETVLISYSDTRNFASLNYSNVTPDPEFFIRVPAVFFEERFPQENEVLELSNSQFVQLNASVKAQRLLKVQPAPFYFHRKMKLILSHQFIEIDDIPWVMEEPYEIQESNPKWPLRKATVWLTEKDYAMRNVL